MTTLAAPDFEYIAQLVHRRSAIVLEPGKEYLAESRLESVAREHGLATVTELVKHMRNGSLAVDDLVVDAMTTNETSFFRDAHPFNALRDSVLPELIEARRVARSITIWCGATSSGQEPYSLAMLIREHFPELNSWQVRIIATDISPSMLARTREGRYSQLEVNRGLPAPMLVKYFTRDGMHWVVTDDLKRMVSAQFLNLNERWPVLPPFDLVLLRNVLIYFDVPTKQEILAKVRHSLRPDGLLLLGGAETTMNLDAKFERIPHGRSTWYRPTGA
ncbi:MAG: protein-glutamate O-methyltransferase CheR [Actinomycetia bacterium]|nr:protein-glutamate O-methyltransferase CheR [Actinomycetes bacterium]